MESHNTTTQSPGQHNPLDTGDPNNWPLPASILAGSIIVGVFQPLFLVVSLGTLIWIGFLCRSYSRRLFGLASDKRRLEDKIKRAQLLAARLQSILESADVPILTTNNNGSIIQANLAAKLILGSGRPLIGEHFDSLITQNAVHELERLARSGESGHARLELPVGGDMRIFDVAANPITNTRGAVCTFTDITELSHSATLKADFAANASHELRTPIASILAAIQTLEGPAKNDPAMIQRLIQMISSNASRLDLIVKDLLDLSKLESTLVPVVLTDVNLADLVEQSSLAFSSACERRGLTIETRINPECSIITSNESMLELILPNLIGNATKFAHENTTITIHAESIAIGIDPENPLPDGLDGTRGVRIGVRDEGIGIPLSQQQRIFERFYQVDEARDGSSARRGTGLGLAIVKHAARSLGGSVRLKSIHQQGTTMIVELPGCVSDIGKNADSTP
ncbi:MAG: PAS domain S-box protein [Phycisphaerales bacterium]|nr:PAS domain S-box protein [Phycisphaerales bacterium]